MKRIKFITLPILGLISGIITNYLMYGLGWDNGRAGEEPLLGLIAPGLTFGICMAVWLLFFNFRNPLKLGSWLAVSTLAYCLAHETAITLTYALAKHDTLSLYLPFLTAGLLGSTFVAVMFSKIVPFYPKFIYFVIAVGGFAGLGYDLIRYYELWPDNTNWSYLYLSWQTLVALALAIAINKKYETR